MTKSDLRKIKKLNSFYFDSFSEEQTVDLLIYMTSKQREKGNRTSESFIRKAYQNREIGYLIHRLDPIAFELSEI